MQADERLPTTFWSSLKRLGAGLLAPFWSGSDVQPLRETLGVRVVLISDTHGNHRQLGALPEGDVLIHGGDYTKSGSHDDAVDFNTWLGELPYAHKIVVNGNHEYNASWKRQAASILSNACAAGSQTPERARDCLRIHFRAKRPGLESRAVRSCVTNR